jgi:hypothetical protein
MRAKVKPVRLADKDFGMKQMHPAVIRIDRMLSGVFCGTAF